MTKIDSTEFGSITIDGVKYGQVLIVGGQVLERDYDRLKKLFGTSHKIGDWELAELLKGDPQAILIGTGQEGRLEVSEEIAQAIRNQGLELIIETTPLAIQTFNNQTQSGKRLNALIHTTC